MTPGGASVTVPDQSDRDGEQPGPELPEITCAGGVRLPQLGAGTN